MKETDGIPVPHDYDDFNRCKQLLDNHGEWISKFQEKMGKVSATWAKIAAIWWDLNMLHLDNKQAEITSRLQQLV